MPLTSPEPLVALELTLSQALLRRLHRALDADPTLSLDAIAHMALSTYLAELEQPPGDRPLKAEWMEL